MFFIIVVQARHKVAAWGVDLFRCVLLLGRSSLTWAAGSLAALFCGTGHVILVETPGL